MRFLILLRFLCALSLAALVAGAPEPARAGGEGFKGWGGFGDSYFPTPEAACADHWNAYRRNGMLGEKSQFIGASQIGPFFWGCIWTTYQWGCNGGINDCGTVLPPTIAMSCDAGYGKADAGRCVKIDEAVPPQNKCPYVADPIILADGAKYETMEDFSTGDGLFFLKRHYRNFYSYARFHWADPPGAFFVMMNNAPWLGVVGGWRFNFQMELHIDGYWGDYATLFMPDGVGYSFQRSGSSFSPWAGDPPQSRYALQYDGAAPSDWTNVGAAPTQWKIVDAEEKRIWTFRAFPKVGGSSGDAATHYNVARPIRMELAGGYAWSFNYDANGVLQSIGDSYGRQFNVKWNNYYYPDYPSSHPEPISVAEISLPGGARMAYSYDPPLRADGSSEHRVGRLVTARRLDGASSVLESTTYHYEDARFPDYLTGVTDGRGIRYATFAYDAAGRSILAENAGGADRTTVAYGRQADGTLTRRVTNPLGKVAEYRFGVDHDRRVYSGVVGEPSAACPGSARGYTYDANGWVATETDEEGRVTSYVRDARNRPTSITRGAGTPQAVATTLEWHATYDIATRIVEPGLTTNVAVNAAGLITQISKVDTTTQTVPYPTNGQTRTTAYGYNATGRLTSVDGPLAGTGDRTLYAYTSAGNLQTITNEMGHVTTVTAWNGRGQPTSITDPNGVVTTLAYTRGLLRQMSVDTSGGAATTSIEYDAVGQVTKITLPNGAFESYAYDNARRLTTIVNSAGETVTYVRNANGDATSVTVKRANATVAYARIRAYDELGRLIRSIGAGSQSYQFGYDKTDNLKTVTDPRSNVFSYGFDPLNRLISETDEESKTVNLTRNGTDDVTIYTDARDLSTSYIRNGFGEVIREVSPDRGTITYWRDARGLVTQRTDARGVATHYSYDNAGRLTGKTYLNQSASDNTLYWDYPGNDSASVGRLSSIVDAAGQNYRVFDTKGRVAWEGRYNIPAPWLITQYAYDGAGNITTILYPSGRRVDYSRDAMGRVSAVTTRQNAAALPQTVVSSVQWNPYGPLASMSFGYGATAIFTTDTDYRLTRIEVGYAGTGDILDRSYVWTGDMLDAVADNRFPGTTPPFTFSAQSQLFTYTPTRRLKSAQGYYGTLGWTYDANGNRLSETANGVTSAYAYPATSNRLTSVTPAGQSARTFAYDASGDIVTDSRSGALGMSFEYDVEGRLSKVYQTNAPSQGATYAYDGYDRLSKRTATSGATTTLYIHDVNDHIIAETDTAGVTKREYIWLNDLPIAVVDKADTAAPVVYYIHTDHLGRPAIMTQDWTWVWYPIYSPFGTLVTTAVNAGFNGPADLRFPGQWFQMESGLAYNWHRHYDATLGRYVQPDPLRVEEKEGETVGGVTTSVLQPTASLIDEIWESGIPRFGSSGVIVSASPSRSNYSDGPNIYGYSTQNPLSKIDPKGLAIVAGPFSSARLDSNIGQCTDASSDLLDTLAYGRMKGVDPCYALDMFWDRGFWPNVDLRRAQKWYKCRKSSLSK